jgi:ribonucleoside-diphosphate reductase beta chain
VSTAIQLKTPQELYEDWERAYWASQDIDLSRDPADWAGLEESERELLYFALSSLMVAEERISTQFCGLVLAQDDEEEGSYLSTQLVDEVRHMQFYSRFQNEVIADPGAIADHVDRAREVLSEPFKEIFDGALVEAHERLRLDPGNREAKVDFVTIYHMVLEGTLGIVTSHFLLDLLAERELLPGFANGYGRIASDEQRHIAYGTWFLREAVRADEGMAEVVRSRLLDLMPAVAASLSPPGESSLDELGLDRGELAKFGLDALSRRLAIIGVPLDPGDP